MNRPEPTLLDTAAAACTAQVSQQSVRHWAARGLLVPVRHERGRPLYDPAAVYAVERTTRRRRVILAAARSEWNTERQPINAPKTSPVPAQRTGLTLVPGGIVAERAAAAVPLAEGSMTLLLPNGVRVCVRTVVAPDMTAAASVTVLDGPDPALSAAS